MSEVKDVLDDFGKLGHDRTEPLFCFRKENRISLRCYATYRKQCGI